MPIKLVFDTCADLSNKDLPEADILPIPVYIDGKEYIPFKNLQPEQFFEFQKEAKTLPHTSAVPMIDAFNCFKSNIEKGNEVLAIFMGSGHSSTYNAACLAKNQLVDELGQEINSRIEIIDSQNVTFPYAALVLEADKLIKEGKLTLKEIADRINLLVPKIHMRAYIDDLTYLKMGGRISGVTASLGNLLNFKIVIKTGENLIVPTDKLRGLPKTYKCIVDTFKKENVDFSLPIYIGHTNDLERAQTLYNLVVEETGIKPAKIINIGPTVGVHVGPGATGLCWFVK